MTHYDTYEIHTCHDKCQHIACVLRRELTAMTKQRDEWEAKYSKEATDNMLAINKIAGERDRLAEVLEQIANTDLYKCDDECAKLMYIASIHNAKQVLQSLTNQPTEP